MAATGGRYVFKRSGIGRVIRCVSSQHISRIFDRQVNRRTLGKKFVLVNRKESIADPELHHSGNTGY